LQQLLVRAGFDVGKVDGVLGSKAARPNRGDADQVWPAGGSANGGAVGADARRPAR
jgi:hypothetical protein